jgi:hypothetical protein
VATAGLLSIMTAYNCMASGPQSAGQGIAADSAARGGRAAALPPLETSAIEDSTPLFFSVFSLENMHTTLFATSICGNVLLYVSGHCPPISF